MVQFGPANFRVIGPERGEYQGLPLSGQITDTFEHFPAWRDAPHGGVDIAASEGAEIRAPADGVAVTNTRNSFFGHYLTLRHDDDTYSGYCHMVEKSPIQVGQAVTRGQVIGHVGSTGLAFGPHLHWVHTKPGNEGLSRARGFVNALDSVTSFAEIPKPPVTPNAFEEHVIEIHVVKSGDTLFALAALWGCTVADICALNSIANRNLIRVGQKLKRPSLGGG